MKKIRRLICLLFLVSCIITALYYVKVKMVEDTVPPQIFCEEDSITVSVKDDMSALMQGMTAKDNRDGDLTEAIRVDYMSHFLNGYKRNVNYVVFDSANQAGSYTRTVIYSDYTPTKIKVNAPFLYLDRDFDKVNFGEFVTAKDCLDGDISNQVRTILDSECYGDPGTYSITLKVSNSAGDARIIPMEITVIDTADDDAMAKAYPLLSDYVVYTKKGKKINPEKYITGLYIGGREYSFEKDSEQLGIYKENVNYSTKEVDYNTPGIYEVTYSCKAEGAPKAVTKLYVVVEGSENE